MPKPGEGRIRREAVRNYDSVQIPPLLRLDVAVAPLAFGVGELQRRAALSACSARASQMWTWLSMIILENTANLG